MPRTFVERAKNPSAFSRIPIRGSITLHDLYVEAARRRQRRERIAKFTCLIVIPVVLATVLHLVW